MNNFRSLINRFLRNGHNDDCLRELVQEHYSKIYLTTAISFFGLSLIGYVNWIVSTQDQKDLLVGWMVSIAALTIIRLSLVAKYNTYQAFLDDNDKTLDPVPWAKLEIFCCGFFGAIVGSIFFIIYEGGLLDNFAHVQIATMVIAMTIAAGGFLAGYLPCYISFAFFSAILVVIKVLILMDVSGLIGLIFFGGFHFLVYGFSKTLNRKYSEPIELRLQSMELIENLARSNDHYEQRNNAVLSTVSLISSNLRSNYLHLLSKVRAAESNNYEYSNANDEIGSELLYLENTSLLVASIVDLELDKKDSLKKAVRLNDSIDRLYDDLKVLVKNKNVTIEHSGDDLSIVANIDAFHLLVRCVASNLIRICPVKSTIIAKGISDINEVHVLLPNLGQLSEHDRDSLLGEDFGLLRQLAMTQNILISTKSDSTGYIGYRLILQ